MSKETKYEDDDVGSSSVNLDILERFLKPAFREVSAVSGKEVYLVIGNTGSGKSAGICYLMGCEIEKNV